MREWKDKRERIFSVFALYSEKQTKISKKKWQKYRLPICNASGKHPEDQGAVYEREKIQCNLLRHVVKWIGF